MSIPQNNIAFGELFDEKRLMKISVKSGQWEVYHMRRGGGRGTKFISAGLMVKKCHNLYLVSIPIL